MINMYKPSFYNHFRQMSDGRFLLFNAITSAICILTEQEMKCIEYPVSNIDDSFLKRCIANGFLVHIDELEYEKVMALRNINNFDTYHVGIQILPTTECNARCFYCYEHDFKKETMDQRTIDSTIEFIYEFTGAAKEITIAWFGGEPLLSEEIISEISKRLIPQILARGQIYRANIITNGSLISEKNIYKIKNDYLVSSAQVSLDGDDITHLKRKLFKSPEIEFNTIINAIKMLVSSGINTLVRLNVDRQNLDDCLRAIDILTNDVGDNNYLNIYAAPLYFTSGYPHVLKKEELNSVFETIYLHLLDTGYIKSLDALPMNFSNATCTAKMINNIVISPSGAISKCEHLLDDPTESIGSVFEGIKYNKAYANWASVEIPEKCEQCKELPICQAGCSAAEVNGFGYGRCSYSLFITDAIFNVAEKIIQRLEVKNQ